MTVWDRIAKRLDETADFAKFGGQKFKLTGADSAGKRTILGPAGVAGSVAPTTTNDKGHITKGHTDVHGSGWEDAPPTVGGGKKALQGWYITYDVNDTRNRTAKNAERTGRFKSIDGTEASCTACNGGGNIVKKNEEKAQLKELLKADPKNEKIRDAYHRLKDEVTPCRTCHGVGLINSRLNAYIDALQKLGKGPAVKPARFKDGEQPVYIPLKESIGDQLFCELLQEDAE